MQRATGPPPDAGAATSRGRGSLCPVVSLEQSEVSYREQKCAPHLRVRQQRVAAQCAEDRVLLYHEHAFEPVSCGDGGDTLRGRNKCRLPSATKDSAPHSLQSYSTIRSPLRSPARERACSTRRDPWTTRTAVSSQVAPQLTTWKSCLFKPAVATRSSTSRCQLHCGLPAHSIDLGLVPEQLRVAVVNLSAC